MTRTLLVFPLALLLLSGCRSQKEEPAIDQGVKHMQLTSTAFQEGGTIPKQYTADGKNVSPPLQWSGAPEGTRNFALVVEDPDAPRGIWTHWVLFNIPPDRHELPEAVPADKTVLGTAKQGTNDFKKIGYGGPQPPPGKPHHYHFKVFALDTGLDLKEGATRQQLLGAMKGHVLAEGELIGLYGHQ